MHLTIEELSQRTRIKIPTIRYYERSNIISADRDAGNTKARYLETDILRLTFLRYGRSVGLVLAEIRAVLEMISVGSSEELETFASFLDERINALGRMSGKLREVSAVIRQGAVNEAEAISALAQLTSQAVMTEPNQEISDKKSNKRSPTTRSASR